MKPAFERFGFASVELLTNWAAYAGADLASFTCPEKLKWSRRNQTDETGKDEGAVLILRVSGARAIEVQHKTPQIIERINAAFGYRAVTAIRICQAPVEAATPAPKEEGWGAGEKTREGESLSLRHPPFPPGGGELKDGHNPRLEKALANLLTGIKNRDASQAAFRTQM